MFAFSKQCVNSVSVCGGGEGSTVDLFLTPQLGRTSWRICIMGKYHFRRLEKEGERGYLLSTP